MGLTELFILAVGLSMDAFAVSVCKIKESFGDEEQIDASMDVKSMFLLAVATSIDALMVGVTFAFLNVAIVPSVLFIGATTFVCSAVGVRIGSIF